ncbi:MAG: hypothetical protein WC373_04845 [Smithella sp.]|jgi:hypothetical protein
MTTQPELFEVRHVGNVTLFETSRLVSGIKNTPALTSPGLPPPAPADVLEAIKNAPPLPPFARNSETSRQAAIRILRSSETTKNEAELSQWMEFRGCDGATDDEIKEHLAGTEIMSDPEDGNCVNSGWCLNPK